MANHGGPEQKGVTELLHLAGTGDAAANEELFRVIYHELRRMARGAMRAERDDHTLQPTGLVHEAFLRLVGEPIVWADRAHFFAVAARTMRRVLIDHARRGKAQKKFQGKRVELEDAIVLAPGRDIELLALDEAMNRLEQKSERECRIVELRYFGGLTFEEIAAALNISVKTAQRDWTRARAWLNRELSGSAEAAVDTTVEVAD